MVKKTVTPICFGFIILLFSVLTHGCRSVPDSLQATAPSGDDTILRVGVSTHAPPIIFKQNQVITGLEAALAQELGRFLDKKIIFIEVPWSKQLDFLNEGKTDIVMSGMTITPQRSYLADFVTPYLRSGQILLVRMEDQRKFSRGVADLLNTKYKIGTVADTTGDFFVTETISNANEVTFKTSHQGVEALINKEIDVLVYDAPMVCHYAAINQSEKLIPVLIMATEEYLAWAVRKDDKELKENAERFLEKIRENGLLNTEINRWIPYLNRN